jgi:hypothetical protein
LSPWGGAGALLVVGAAEIALRLLKPRNQILHIILSHTSQHPRKCRGARGAKLVDVLLDL